MITIFIPTPLRKFTDNQSQVKIEAASVADAIAGLTREFPELEKHLLDNDRQIRKFVRIYVGDEDINQLSGATTTLKPGDAVSIIPAIAGGTR